MMLQRYHKTVRLSRIFLAIYGSILSAHRRQDLQNEQDGDAFMFRVCDQSHGPVSQRADGGGGA